MKNIDIALYTGSIGHGGAERVAVTLASEFASRGLSVAAIANRKLPDEYELPDAIKRIYLDTESAKASFVKRNYARVSRLRNACSSFDISCLICFMGEQNIRGLLAGFGLRTNVFPSVRNDPKREYPGRMLDVADRFFRHAAGVVFQTSEAMSAFSAPVRDISKVIINPIGDAFYDISPADSYQRLISVGRLVPQKNFPLLIEAFSIVVESFPESYLEIYGEGPCRASLKMLIEEKGLSEKIRLKGRFADMPSVLAKGGVFVMSSDYEGMPNALMEAQAAGLPVIATDCPCGGPRSLIEDGRSGLLVPVGDSSSLASAISRLLDSYELRRSLGEAAHAAASRYRISLVADAWLDFVGHGQ